MNLRWNDLDRLPTEDLWRLAESHAVERHDGHLSVFRFTTNWRAVFGTPTILHEELPNHPAGPTLHHALVSLLGTHVCHEEREAGK